MRKQTPKSYEYISSLANPENEDQLHSRKCADTLGLGAISLSQVEGEALAFLVKIARTKKAIEVGTLTGLSAQYILRAMPQEGKLWTLEKSEEHARLARESLTDARCQIVIGDAEESLKALATEGPFDFVFIDGNKSAYLRYFEWALANTKQGSIVVVDNVFLSGAVWGDATTQKFNKKQIEAVQTMNQMAMKDPRVTSMILPTEEGLLVSLKN